MKRLVLVLLLIAAVSGLHAQEDDAASTVTVGLSSQRIVRGVKQSSAGGQGSFEVVKDAWRIGAEVIQPFDRDEPGEGNLTAAYTWHATKQLRLEASITPRWFSNVPPGATKHSVEAGVSAAWTLPHDFSFELAAFHDWRLKAETLQATLNYSMPLKRLGAYLEWSASVGSASARDLRPDAVGSPAPVRDGYTYYTASVRLPYRIGPHSTLVAGAHLAKTAHQSPLWSPIDARGGTRAWVELGLNFDF